MNKSRPTDKKFQTKSALYGHVRDMLVLERLCLRFHLVATQLEARYENRQTLRVADEQDLGDLLHALLILEYDDVQREGRAVFLLMLERIVIAAKFIQSDFDTDAFAKQMESDAQKYHQRADCDTLVCFLYDPKNYIANPREIESDFSAEDVRVIISPKGV